MAAKNLFLFTGKNRYALSEELKRWQEEFVKRHGEDNLHRLSGGSLSLRELLDVVSVAPFLASSRLVVVDGLPKFSSEETQQLLKAIHPSTVIVFIERPTKGKQPSRELAEAAVQKDFPAMKRSALQQWAVATAAERGFTLHPSAAQKLVMLLDDDQQFLAVELQKLSLQYAGKSPTMEELESAVLPLEGALWSVTDFLAQRKASEALLEARRLLRAGADPYALWNIILAFVKNAVLVAAALEAGITSSDAVAKRTGVHPFVLRSLLGFARHAGTAGLQPLLYRALDLDRALKTGELRATDDADIELTSALDTLLLSV